MNPAQANATPDTNLETQDAVFELTGPTATGSRAPIPFTSNLPCTSDCPETETATFEKSKSTQRIMSRTSKAGADGARPTGMRGAWKAIQELGNMHLRDEI